MVRAKSSKGKAPGEIALSVVAEIVATAYGRRGGPMRA
jgi:xanthine dehydrogenase accessory factor